jgi:hypothetical protein
LGRLFDDHRIVFAKDYLTEEADVEQYVDAVKQALLAEIRAGKKLIV